MRKLLIIAGAAAMAAAMPALAKPDKGGGEGGGKPAKAERGNQGGGGKPDKAERAERGGKPDRADRAQRGGGKPDKAQRAERAERGGKPDKADRAKPAKSLRADRREDKPSRADRRFEERRDQRRAERRDDRRDYDRRDYDRRDHDRRDVVYPVHEARSGGFGCPPGLARKNNGCMPPGQAKKAFALGTAVPAAYFGGYNLPERYDDWYYDQPEYYYRYDDSGYIYGIDRETSLVESLIPLFGGGFSVGSLLPAGYDVYNVPQAYRDDYYDTDDSWYRYGDDAIYQVDPQSGTIEQIVALLAGNLDIGQQLPAGYDAYNLPLDYRDQYVDGDEAMYRYADGAIYEVDPRTRIVEAIVAMLA